MIQHRQSKILFVSTFPPKKCGIASFTQDLIRAIEREMPANFSIGVCALEKKTNHALYRYPVDLVMDGFDFDSCIETAKLINADTSIKLICIEHEFGLYGGELGEHLLGFLALLEKAFIIRFHTVLPSPEPRRRKLVRAMCSSAAKIIVMTKNSARILEQDYQLPAEKVIIIPHGTHDNSAISTNDLKHKYNLDNKLVLTSFGLLSPNKGIEKGILAMKEISVIFPEAIYIVLGQTHPNLQEQEGEKYRNYLQQLTEDNELEKNVRMVNEYSPTQKLMEYLRLTDLYLFTSKDPNQAVSGTFLYAMSAGCPIISNSFVLAKEMLDEETGIILETNSENELAENAIGLLRNDLLRKHMSENAFLKTRETTWEKVGRKHSDLFFEIVRKPVITIELTDLILN
jgi:glycosyltransferase involved in cell wall biosynthesis